jgi:hypothetical protein
MLWFPGKSQFCLVNIAHAWGSFPKGLQAITKDLNRVEYLVPTKKRDDESHAKTLRNRCVRETREAQS